MHKPKPEGQVVFHSPWFQVRSRQTQDSPHPHFTIDCPDFVALVALEPGGGLLLVRQYRHGVGAFTLELPSGHVDAGDSAEETARKELLEETGYAAGDLELLSTLSPSTARFTNRLWCYLARDARPAPGAIIEPGMELVVYRKGVKSLLNEPEFYSAPNYGALCVAILSGKLGL